MTWDRLTAHARGFDVRREVREREASQRVFSMRTRPQGAPEVAPQWRAPSSIQRSVNARRVADNFSRSPGDDDKRRLPGGLLRADDFAGTNFLLSVSLASFLDERKQFIL